MSSARDKALSLNTLTCLIQGCVGHRVIIELRNDDSVEGVVSSVDAYMNVHMFAVKFTKAKTGSEFSLEDMYVKGKNIRYVQIPDEVDMMDCIRSQLSEADAVRSYRERKAKPRRLTKAERKELLDRRVEAIRENLGDDINMVEKDGTEKKDGKEPEAE